LPKDIADANAEAIRRDYEMAFTRAGSPYNSRNDNRFRLTRFQVPPDWTPAQLLAELEHNAPIRFTGQPLQCDQERLWRLQLGSLSTHPRGLAITSPADNDGFALLRGSETIRSLGCRMIVHPDKSGESAVYLRYSNPKSYIRVRVLYDVLQVQESTAAGLTTLLQYPLPEPGKPVRLAVQVKGNRVTMWANDILASQYPLPLHGVGQGSFGVGARGENVPFTGRFDDVTVRIFPPMWAEVPSADRIGATAASSLTAVLIPWPARTDQCPDTTALMVAAMRGIGTYLMVPGAPEAAIQKARDCLEKEPGTGELTLLLVSGFALDYDPAVPAAGYAAVIAEAHEHNRQVALRLGHRQLPAFLKSPASCRTGSCSTLPIRPTIPCWPPSNTGSTKAPCCFAARQRMPRPRCRLSTGGTSHAEDRHLHGSRRAAELSGLRGRSRQHLRHHGLAASLGPDQHGALRRGAQHREQRPQKRSGLPAAVAGTGKHPPAPEKYPEAIVALKQVRAVNPRDPEANLLLFQVLAAAPDQVVAAAGLSLPAFLDSLETADIAAILTYLLENSRQTQLMQTFIAHWSPKAAQQQALAAILKRYAGGDLEAAEKQLVSDQGLATTYGKTLARFVYLIGVAYRDAGRYDDALRAFHEAATMGHDPTEIQGEIGWVYLRMGDAAKAMAIWEAHWREATNPGDWTLWIGNTAMDAGDYAKAVTFYRHALGFQPKDPLLRGRYLCALLLAKQDDTAAAYRQQLEREGAGDSVVFGQALLAMKEKRPDAALEALSHLGNPYPFREEITAMAREIASIPGARGVVEQRARAIAALLRDSPAEASILRDLAWTLWNAGSADAALHLWDTALDLGLPQADPLKRQVVLRLLEAGKTPAARTFLQRHMPRVSPLGLAVSLAQQGKPDIAAQLLATGPAGKDADWTALVDAACLLRTGDAAKALEQLDRLAQRTSPLPSLRLMSFDEQGALLPQPLTQQEALAFYRQIAHDMIDQDIEKGFVFLAKPAWLPALSSQDSAALQAQAGAVAMRAGREAQGSALCRAALAL